MSEAVPDKPDADDAQQGGKRYALRLTNVDKYATQKDLKKALDKAGIQAVKIKKVHNLQVGQIWFESDEERAKALELLDGMTIRKSTIAAEVSDAPSNAEPPKPRPAKGGAPKDDGIQKSPEEMIKDQVTPLWRNPYESQLDEKTKQVKNSLGLLKKKGSALPVFDRAEKKGFWRLIQVRTQESGENLLIVQANESGESSEAIATAKQSVISTFSGPDFKPHVTTIIWQNHEGPHHGISDKAPFVTIYGPGVIHETLLGLKFRISATAFFQVNTKATELLYDRIRQWALESDNGVAPGSEKEESNNVVALDLCCGTGTIGLTMARHVKRVIGVELVPEAIEDAKANAAANGITNVVYYASKVEDVIKEILEGRPSKKTEGENAAPDAEKKDDSADGAETKDDVTIVTETNGAQISLIDEDDRVVAILDPPRSGVHANVIKSVRACTAIRKLIYVSCDFRQAMTNIQE
ncbi:tRNA methyltransferase 2 [Phlyctochytrium bullatum]|nr:tRNA methyltransferase 2 [Phlyctochytrium bullatum]